MLASSLLIAEAWNPDGLYQVGWFVAKGSRFSEWSGPFRDDVRRFVKATFSLSGTPMLSLGDEKRRTMASNSNAYCQNSESNYFDWSLFSRIRGIYNFTKDLFKLTRHFNQFRPHRAQKSCLQWPEKV